MSVRATLHQLQVMLRLFGDDPVRPLDKRHKNRGTAELCSPLAQIRFRHAPRAAASTASANLNVFGDDFIKSLSQRSPADGHERICHGLSHNGNRFAQEEDLYFMPGFGKRMPM